MHLYHIAAILDFKTNVCGIQTRGLDLQKTGAIWFEILEVTIPKRVSGSQDEHA